ncbi:MAG: ABC transporter permease subunit [Spirochaetes bacterium]|nr:ABC transporter permease subunit [Spirochaetota bacterium]
MISQNKVTLKTLKYHWDIYLFIIPTLIIIGIFSYYPALSGVFHSFFKWNGADIADPVGFDNYLDLFKNKTFWESFKLVFILGAFNLLKMIPALLVAVCIHRCKSDKMQFLYRVLFVVPMIVPGLVIVLVWRSFFFETSQGYLNQFINFFGIKQLLLLTDKIVGWGIFRPDQNPAWLGNPKLIVTAMVLWGFPWVGSFGVLAHLAKLQGVDNSVYEAADIDGVNWWTKFTKIELPYLFGSIYVLLIFTIIDTIRDAGTVLALVGIDGGPGGVATVPALFMLRKAFVEQDMGYACAIGIVLTVIVFGLQNISSFTSEWKQKSKTQRNVFRIILMAIALGLAYGNRLWAISFVLILGSLPYELLSVYYDKKGYFKRVLLLVAGSILFAVAYFGGKASPLPPLSPLVYYFAAMILGMCGMPWSFLNHFMFVRRSANAFEALLRILVPLAAIAGIVTCLPLFNGKPAIPYTPFFFVLFLFIAIAAIPYRDIKLLSIRMRGHEGVDPDIIYQQYLDFTRTGLYRLGYSVTVRFLRFMKHFTIILVLFFAFIPFYLMMIVSLKNNSQFYGNPLTLEAPFHWENWQTAWTMVGTNVANSIFITGSIVVLAVLLALAAAYFFIRIQMPLQNLFWNAILLLMMLPSIANLVPLFRLLKDMNLLNTFTALICVGTAGALVGSVFILKNFITDIPKDLFEAAEIDGASHLQQMANVVLPLSGPIIATVGIMRFVHEWNDFLLPLIIMRDNTKLPITVQLLRMSGEYFKLWGPLMAGYALAAIPVILLFIFAMRFFIRGLSEGGTKY